MKKLAPLTLRGRHVYLEPLTPAHAPALFAAAMAGSRATYGLTVVPSTLETAEAYVALALAEHEKGTQLPFVVKDREGAVVGSTRYMTIEWWTWPEGTKAPAPIPSGPDALEIGATWYAERVQRTALNTEAKLLLCTHAFEVYGSRRMMWKTDARNVRSRTAIARLGATFDGVLRAHMPAWDGAIRDTAFFSMLASEWPAAKARLEGFLDGGAKSKAGASV
jgi:RimJ/RimL family protein N-acetyltransferase